MNKQSTTVYVTARQAELDALNIEIALRLKLSDWDQVHHALSGVSGVAIPMREMIGGLRTNLRASHRTAAHTANKDTERPSASAEFDTDDLDDLQVLMRFTFRLDQWIRLLDQLRPIHRADATDRLYQSLGLAVCRLKRDFTVQLVGEPDAEEGGPQTSKD